MVSLLAVGSHAADGAFWCNAVRHGDCVLPGVGPTYACGVRNGGSGYQSSENRRTSMTGLASLIAATPMEGAPVAIDARSVGGK